ncbi:MAG: tyrosine-type recombinase/integrase [Actinomycetota bacterium]
MPRKIKRGWSIFQRADADGKRVLVLAYQRGDASWGQHRLPDTIRGKHEADRYAATWIAEQRANGKLDAPLRRGESATIAELFPRWLKLREANPRLKASTVADNKSHGAAHILSTLGPVAVDTLTVPRLREWVRLIRGRVQSASAARNILATLSSFLGDCIAEGWTVLRENPGAAKPVRAELPEVTRDDVVFLSLDHAQTLVDCAGVPVDRAVRYVLGFLTGMRDGELAGGSMADVHLDDVVPTWHVVRACQCKGEAGYATMGTPKTRRSKRIIPLHPTAVAALRWWFDDGWPMLMGRDPKPEDPVFPSPVSGEHYRPRSADLIRDDLRSAGAPVAPGVDFRACRRSFATWLYEAGVDEETRGRLMGHAPQSVTSDHYTATVLARLSEAVARIPLRCIRCAEYCAPRTIIDVAAGQKSHEPPKQSDESAPVAQGIEQRFPNTSGSTARIDDEIEPLELSPAYAALISGASGNDARKTTSAQWAHNGRGANLRAAQTRRNRQAEAGQLLGAAVTIAQDSGRPDDVRRREVHALLRRTAELLEREKDAS